MRCWWGAALVMIVMCETSIDTLCPADHSPIGDMSHTPTPGPTPFIVYSWADDDNRPMGGGDNLVSTDTATKGAQVEERDAV
jgi:hypothetical protein